MTTLLDPTSEIRPAQREATPRLDSLQDKTVGLLDISKPRGDVFLDHLAAKLSELGVESRRYSKPTFARIAPVETQQQIVSECDVVIEALAD